MTRYINLAEFYFLAEQVTGLDATIVVEASRTDLADSTLHAPAAGFGHVRTSTRTYVELEVGPPL